MDARKGTTVFDENGSTGIRSRVIQQYRWQFTRTIDQRTCREKRFSTGGNENPPDERTLSVTESKFETPPFQPSTRKGGKEGGLVVPFNFKHRSNTPLPKLKGNVCLSVTKFAPYRDNVPPSSRNLSRHPLFPPLFSFFIAQRLNVDAWKVGRERVLIGNLIPFPPSFVQRWNT